MKKVISAILCIVLVFSAVSFSANAAARLTYVTNSDAGIAKVGSKIVGTGSASCDSSVTEYFIINVAIQSRTRYTTTESWRSEKVVTNTSTDWSKSAAGSVDYDSTKEYRTKVTIIIHPADESDVVYNYKYTAIYRP